MKFKHLLMAGFSLLLPACSNNQKVDETPQVQTQKTESVVDQTPNTQSRIISQNNSKQTTDDPSKDIGEVTPLIPEPAEEEVSTFTTKIYTKTNARMNNLKVVANKINDYIIEPNEVFSYNEVCGPYNKENGFQKATIFVNNKDVQEYGGGVCQVSSTLYNAVKNVGVEIIERHNHSKDVFYVPRNQDATVSYSSKLDFKFKNLNEYAIKLKTSIEDKKAVTVSVYKLT